MPNVRDERTVNARIRSPCVAERPGRNRRSKKAGCRQRGRHRSLTVQPIVGYDAAPTACHPAAARPRVDSQNGSFHQCDHSVGAARCDRITAARKTVVADLGFRGVDANCAPVQVMHRWKFKSLDKQQRRWLKRRQAIEPVIVHAKSDNRMDRCWLSGSSGDALHAVLCAAGFNIRWLLRAIAVKGAQSPFAGLLAMGVVAKMDRIGIAHRPSRARGTDPFARLTCASRADGGKLKFAWPTNQVDKRHGPGRKLMRCIREHNKNPKPIM